ncbi:hypothetical protein YDYSG_12860 [Paenibacillus tyrfis]|nr:hypothetical protein YDYSG_12860 [Paenibacillus tyrfis]
MAKSQAWKKRRKLEREGSRNPELSRGSWYGVVPVERTTPTLHEKQRRLMDKHKKKWNRTLPPDSDGSIFYCYTISVPFRRCFAYNALPTTPASSIRSAGLMTRSSK